MAAPLYQRIAAHYLDAIQLGALPEGERFPSVRTLMRRHAVSLSTALQACRHLEDQGWLQARPRSGYFVQVPPALTGARLPPASDPTQAPGGPALPDAAAYVGIHAHVSQLLAQGQRQPVRINLATVVGPPSLYPTAALQKSLQQQLRRHPDCLTRQADSHGLPAFKEAVVQRALARGLGGVSPSQVTVTHGCMEAMNLALRAVTQPGDTVAVESPTFYGMLQVLEALGLRALEIPTSPRTGISLDALAFALEHGPAPRAVLCMPNLHNPLGCVMPDAHKQALVELCARHALPLIEDDIYGDMGAGPQPLRPLKAWDQDGGVIRCSSLCKTLAPGLRLGWLCGGRWQDRIEMLKYSQSRFAEELPQRAAADVLASPAYERHLKLLQHKLSLQRRQMADAVACHFPPGTRLSLPDGGMLLWLQLPDGVPADALFQQALAEGIRTAPGSMFSNGRHFANHLRLSCGGPHTPAVEAALLRLGQLATAAMASPPREARACASVPAL
jgi:DNA-binding transcriptional MocR family regulator